MRKVVMTFGIAALVAALGGVGYAQTTKSAKPAKTSTSAPKEASATGKIVGFDDASKTLTISTSKGEEKFVLGSTVQLHEGSKTITSANLSSLTGQQAKVRYTVSGSDKTAASVMVSEPAHSAKKK